MHVFRNLLIAVLVLVGAYGAHTWWQASDRSPETLIASAVERLESRQPNLDVAVRELDRALALARAGGDLTLAQEALFQRARAYGERRMPTLALRDARAALGEFGARPDILEFAARTALWAGEVELTLEYAQRLGQTDSESEIGPDLVGRAYRLQANRELDEARGLLLLGLADEVSQEALALARYAAILDGESAARRVALERIRALTRDETLFAGVRRHVEAAGRALDASREAFLNSLEVRASPEAMEAFLELYLSAGQDRLAAALARTAGKRRRFQGGDGTVLLRTAQALVRIGRTNEARRLLRRGRRPAFQNLQMNDLADWCGLLRTVELWPLLTVAARRYRVKAEGQFRHVAEAQFYDGVAALRQGEWEEALAPLRGYGLESGPELYEGARAEAWMGVALAAQRLGRDLEEQRALSAFARVCPDVAKDAAQAHEFSQTWLHRAQYQMDAGVAGQAEVSLTHAMRFDPTRIEELSPAWHRLGEAARASRGRELFTNQGVPLRAEPDPRAGADELLTYAEYCLAPVVGEPLPSRAAVYGRRTLRAFPDFLPALDILGRAYLAAEDLDRAAETLVRQVEVGGPAAGVSVRLERIGTAQMSGDLVVRWARADPAGVLLEPFIDELFDAERPELALEALRRQRRGGRRPALVVRTASLFARSGAWQDADSECNKLSPADDEFGAHASLLLESAWRGAPGGKATGPLLKRIEALGRTASITDPDLPDCIDRLLVGGQLAPVVRLLELLDRRPNVWGERLLLRRAATALLGRDHKVTNEALDRGEALGDGRSARLGRMLLYGEQAEWASVARTARRLARDGDEVDLYRAGILAALGGDFRLGAERLRTYVESGATARPLAELALRACEAHLGRLAGPGPEATGVERVQHLLLTDLLLGYEGVAREPRTVLLWLLSAEDESWSVWLLATLRGLPPRLQASPWVAFLAAESQLSTGEAAAARARILPFAGAVPAVDLFLERIAARAAKGPLDPDLLTIRARRVQRFGAADLDAVEQGLLEVFVQERSRRTAPALRLLRALALDHPDDERVLAPLAERLRAAGLLGDALDAHVHLLEVTARPGEEVPGYLQLLREAETSGVLSRAAHLAELEALEIQFPDDPAVVRELAIFSLETRGERMGAAWARLEAFLADHADESVETMRPGEARRWLEVYLRYDPPRAELFARTELTRTPLSLRAWLMLVEALGRTDRFEAGYALTKDLLSVVPDPELLRWQARFMVALEEPPAAIVQFLDRLDSERARRPRQKRDAELVFLEAQTRLRRRRGDQRWAVARFGELWEDRDRIAQTVELIELTTEYAGALLSSGAAYFDPARAVEVIDGARPYARDALHVDFLRAYKRVAELALAPEEGEEPAPPAEAEETGTSPDAEPAANPDAGPGAGG